MAKTSNKRIKAATLEAPQSREETQSWIKELGDIQRELDFVGDHYHRPAFGGEGFHSVEHVLHQLGV
mgnify:CR=1 FL=1